MRIYKFIETKKYELVAIDHATTWNTSVQVWNSVKYLFSSNTYKVYRIILGIEVDSKKLFHKFK